jgi:hypothetical protein
MKLPKWLVICLLTTSVSAVLAAAGWWWFTWPDRTARQFQSLLVRRDQDAMLAMLLYAGVDYQPDVVVAWLDGSKRDELTLEPQPWTWSDLYRGRRHFRLGADRVIYFIAERGHITEWNTWSSVRVR